MYLLLDLQYHFSLTNIFSEFLKLDLKMNTDEYIGMCVQIWEFLLLFNLQPPKTLCLIYLIGPWTCLKEKCMSVMLILVFTFKPSPIMSYNYKTILTCN